MASLPLALMYSPSSVLAQIYESGQEQAEADETTSGPTGSSAPVLECDVAATLAEVGMRMSLGRPPMFILSPLSATQDCFKTSDEKFQLYFIRSLAYLQSGEIELARADARDAADIAVQDEDAGRARHLLQLLESSFGQLAFTVPDNPMAAPGVQIENVAPGSLPPLEDLYGLFSEPPIRYLSQSWSRSIDSARSHLANGEERPIKVWLPRGNYQLDTGQIVVVGPGIQTVEVRVERFAHRTLGIASTTLVTFPVAREGSYTSGRSISPGVSVHGSRRVPGVGPRSYLAASWFYLPASWQWTPASCHSSSDVGTVDVAAGNPCADPLVDEVAWKVDPMAASQALTLGLQFPLSLGGERVAVVPGLGLRALALPFHNFDAAPITEAKLVDAGAEPTHLVVATWMGGLAVAQLGTQVRIFRGSGGQLNATLSGEVGAGPGTAVGARDMVAQVEGEDVTINPQLAGLLKWEAMGSLSIGLTWLEKAPNSTQPRPRGKEN